MLLFKSKYLKSEQFNKLVTFISAEEIWLGKLFITEPPINKITKNKIGKFWVNNDLVDNISDAIDVDVNDNDKVFIVIMYFSTVYSQIQIIK